MSTDSGKKDLSSQDSRKKQSPKARQLQQKQWSVDVYRPLIGAVGHRTPRRPGVQKERQELQQRDAYHGEVAVREDTTSNLAEISIDESQSDIADDALRFGQFHGVVWEALTLNGCDAHGADFGRARLIKLCALGADFSSALFVEADLAHAVLCGANLQHTDFSRADLSHVNLSWANLRGAKLSGCDLRHANLSWADLREVELSSVDLTGVYYNSKTRWPDGFAPDQFAMIDLYESR